ncbi:MULTISPECIES: c-type cytochrome [Acidiphilium]|uniref:Thiosulfate dehydrogenase n=1 Tax=Acidiphilium rubrum TaxID=526 RepID=A0A8G2CP23_ACIRU|nr:MULTISPECIES: c-type cytochrome [Acidiphilium]MCW8308720.1 c-type cytochrome [Acidiphilium sp. PA]SIR54207.1 thiosulfate dehydrogenase [Acidiphilium rubrum]
MTNRTKVAVIIGGIGLAAAATAVGWHGSQPSLGMPRAHAATATQKPVVFTPPPDSEIPKGKFGDMIKLGENVFRHPDIYAKSYVGNHLRCSNCHLSAGRLADAAPMWAAYSAYPAYRSKNGKVNSFEERLQGCFRFSMNGKVPKLGSKTLIALESYSYFLAKGAPLGEKLAGRGYPKLPKPALPVSYSRGAVVYAQHCAACHGATGQGQSSGGKVVFPALWGPQSFNWGAGMGSVKNAADFTYQNMPLGMPKSLTQQQAWDVATYIDSQVRPEDPRYLGSVAATRKKFHHTKFSMYGKTVNGVLLGQPDQAKSTPGVLPK